MKHLVLTTVLVLAATAPALADDQLALSLGVEPGRLTTAQLSEIKSVVDNDNNNRAVKALIERYALGGVASSMSVGSDEARRIATIAALTDNDDNNRAHDAFIERAEGGIASTTSIGISPGHAQLAANLGVDASEYSLVDLVNLKASYDATDPTN